MVDLVSQDKKRIPLKPSYQVKNVHCHSSYSPTDMYCFILLVYGYFYLRVNKYNNVHVVIFNFV